MSYIPVHNLYDNEKLTSLIECIKEIEDPRKRKGQIKHPFVTIIIMAICSIIGGANNWIAVELFSKDHLEWFSEFLDVAGIAPSHDTFNRIFSLLGRDFQNWLSLWLEQNLNYSEYDEINIDGKMLNDLSSEDPFIFVRAWSNVNQIVLTQVKVKPGTNEITTIPNVLNELNLKDKVVTIDAIGTQKKIVKLIADKSADYVLPLKRNHHEFFNDVQLFMDDFAGISSEEYYFDYCETKEKDHGRIEIRRCWSTENISWLSGKNKWKNIRSISVIETLIQNKSNNITNRRYFISSLPANAERILNIVRNHWKIENKLHWHLNVAFQEDRSTIRKGLGAHNLSFLRGMCLSLLAKEPSNLSLNCKRFRASYMFPFMMKILLNWA